MNIKQLKKSYEYIIIGSGFGGSFAAHTLAKAGKEVLIIERGKWVTRDDSCWDEVRLHLKDPLYRGKAPFYVDQKKGKIEESWPDDTVGGMSTFYGGVSYRMREDDFLGAPRANSIERDADSAWPYAYKDISPYYREAEELLGIAGIRGKDITEPPMEKDYLHRPHEVLAAPSRKIWEGAEKLGLHPYMLPMAINFSGKYGKEKCISCSTCDHYLCKIEAKNDLSVTVLPEAMELGAALISNTRVLKINISEKKAESVDIIDQKTGEQATIQAKNIIAAGGALASPHLLLTSGVGEATGNDAIGRHLMRHSNGVIAGVFPRKANPDKVLQKQVAIPDYYYGDPEKKTGPEGVWGLIQDVSSIGKGVIKANSPLGLKNVAAFFSDYLINLLCIAEDMPSYENRVFADPEKKDLFGMPALSIHHRYHERDIQARAALYGKAKKILRKAGALMFYTLPIETFSHALGTCRMGTSEKTAVVDSTCKVFGMDNLYVMDGGVMPSGGSVNPSLTIGALTLKATKEII
ncbi:MAG: GMC family oxidoreductase [bacterium]|nr:GMC family oxidoreductase [bacterium]